MGREVSEIAKKNRWRILWTAPLQACHSQCRRKIWKSGGTSSNVMGKICPLVEIGLTAHHISTCLLGFSDLPTALTVVEMGPSIKYVNTFFAIFETPHPLCHHFFIPIRHHFFSNFTPPLWTAPIGFNIERASRGHIDLSRKKIPKIHVELKCTPKPISTSTWC